MRVKPKKHLGQHFLKNEAICERIAEAVTPTQGVYTFVGNWSGNRSVGQNIC